MQITDRKKAFREKQLQKRKNDLVKDRIIYNKLISSEWFTDADLILSYVSTPEELDTRELIRHCFDIKKPLAVPKTVGNDLVFRLISEFDDLEPGLFGISEPREHCGIVSSFDNSLCVVPALAFNKSNYRIGYGKGFYDRFLRDYAGFSVGLCYKENVTEIPYDDFDVPVDLVLTD